MPAGVAKLRSSDRSRFRLVKKSESFLQRKWVFLLLALVPKVRVVKPALALPKQIGAFRVSKPSLGSAMFSGVCAIAATPVNKKAKIGKKFLNMYLEFIKSNRLLRAKIEISWHIILSICDFDDAKTISKTFLWTNQIINPTFKA